ncbi:hypothetical protein GCM10029992_37760 [Glycomyces albus]
MKTSKHAKRKLLTLAGAVMAVFVLRALADGPAETGSPGSTGTGIDLSPVRSALGSLTETVVLWVVVIPGALYLVYLAAMKVAPAQMRKDHNERAAKRMRKWGLIAAIALIVVAYAVHYVPILAREAAAWTGRTSSGAASGIGSAARAFGDNWLPILWMLVFATVLLLGFRWSSRADGKIEQLARFGMVALPAALISLALSKTGAIGA